MDVSEKIRLERQWREDDDRLRIKRWEHKEFILLAVAPVLMQALLKKRLRSLDWLRVQLQRLDRQLVEAIPWLGRYYWETVVVFEK